MPRWHREGDGARLAAAGLRLGLVAKGDKAAEYARFALAASLPMVYDGRRAGRPPLQPVGRGQWADRQGGPPGSVIDAAVIARSGGIDGGRGVRSAAPAPAVARWPSALMLGRKK